MGKKSLDHRSAKYYRCEAMRIHSNSSCFPWFAARWVGRILARVNAWLLCSTHLNSCNIICTSFGHLLTTCKSKNNFQPLRKEYRSWKNSSKSLRTMSSKVHKMFPKKNVCTALRKTTYRIDFRKRAILLAEFIFLFLRLCCYSKNRGAYVKDSESHKHSNQLTCVYK